MNTKEIKSSKSSKSSNYIVCGNHEQTYCMQCQTKGLYCTHSVMQVQCKDCWDKPFVASSLDEYYKCFTRFMPGGLDW